MKYSIFLENKFPKKKKKKKKKNKNDARVWEIIRSSNQIRRWDKFFIPMLTAGILIKIELLTDQQFTVSAIGK